MRTNIAYVTLFRFAAHDGTTGYKVGVTERTNRQRYGKHGDTISGFRTNLFRAYQTEQLCKALIIDNVPEAVYPLDGGRTESFTDASLVPVMQAIIHSSYHDDRGYTIGCGGV